MKATTAWWETIMSIKQLHEIFGVWWEKTNANNETARTYPIYDENFRYSFCLQGQDICPQKLYRVKIQHRFSHVVNLKSFTQNLITPAILRLRGRHRSAGLEWIEEKVETCQTFMPTATEPSLENLYKRSGGNLVCLTNKQTPTANSCWQ